jgi:hypothetical protein
MIEPYEFIDANESGEKERKTSATTELFNKLSAAETNAFRTKINEIAEAVNTTAVPLYPDFRLKYKATGNSAQNTFEVGDIVGGFYNESTIWDLATYNGGDITDKANYTRLVESQDLFNKKGFLSTGLIKNGTISINAVNTKYDISAGVGIITNFDNPEAPTCTVVNFPAVVAKTPTYLTTGIITYIAIKSDGTVEESATPFTNSQRRDLIILGAVVHSNLTNINVVNNISAPTNAIGNQLHDFIEAVGALNLTGNKYSANSANLNLNKSAGSIFKMGVNFVNDWKKPHELAQASETALTFRYRTQNGTEGSDVTVINPDIYDVSNTLTTVPNNKFTIQTINMFQTGLTRIQYGQNYYDSLAEAEAAIFTRNYAVESNIAANGIVRAYIIVKKGTTALNNVADCKIIESTKFGGTASGGVALTLASIVAALGYTPVPETRTLTIGGVTQDLSANRVFNNLVVVNPTVTGSFNIDYTKDTFDLILTGNTTLTESNLPASGQSKVISLYITGNFTLTYPSDWTDFITGSYEGGSAMNKIIVEYISAGRYNVTIIQPD